MHIPPNTHNLHKTKSFFLKEIISTEPLIYKTLLVGSWTELQSCPQQNYDFHEQGQASCVFFSNTFTIEHLSF